MINLNTCITIPESPFKIKYNDEIMFLGSCFADNIGAKMTERKFTVDVNPFGVLYNPISVANSCKRLMNSLLFSKNDLFFYNGMYHSFSHHGRFSNNSVETCLYEINKSLSLSAEHFRKLSYLVITFGTAYIYKYKENGKVVANCHKLPEKLFTRERLKVEQIANEWSVLLEEIWNENPSLKVIFTVSPIRHWKDGAHLNQVSKSTLILAEQLLVEKYTDKVSYFPAYELMMDELRDYRFYAEDMIHPSPLAVEYIWERFLETYTDNETKSILAEIEDINKALNHRPLNPESATYKQFLMQTLLKIQRLRDKNAYLCFTKEEKEIVDKLQNV